MNEAPDLWYLHASYAVTGAAMLWMLARGLWRWRAVSRRLKQAESLCHDA